MSEQLTLDHVDDDAVNIELDFITAGRATFTVANDADRHHTFKVTKKDPEPGSKWERFGPTWFVALLTGPDNERDYTYLGILNTRVDPPEIKLTRASRLTADSQPVKVFNFAVRVLAGRQPLPSGYTIQHDGKCGACGRTLTVPESLRTGLGPICAGRN